MSRVCEVVTSNFDELQSLVCDPPQCTRAASDSGKKSHRKCDDDQAQLLSHTRTSYYYDCCCALAALQSSPQDNNQNASGRLAKESCSSWYEKCPADVKSVKRGVFGWPVPVPTTREGGSESGGISSGLVQGARSAAGALSDDEMATPSQVCGCRRPAGICVGTVTFRSGSDIAIGSRRNSSSSYVGP